MCQKIDEKIFLFTLLLRRDYYTLVFYSYSFASLNNVYKPVGSSMVFRRRSIFTYWGKFSRKWQRVQNSNENSARWTASSWRNERRHNYVMRSLVTFCDSMYACTLLWGTVIAKHPRPVKSYTFDERATPRERPRAMNDFLVKRRVFQTAVCKHEGLFVTSRFSRICSWEI